MATTLAQEYARSHDSGFKSLVEAALFRILPDVIGETTAGSGLKQAQIDKRHAWATEVLRNPQPWVEHAAALLAGEPQIRAVDLPAVPSDAVIQARITALVSDMAGCTAADAV